MRIRAAQRRELRMYGQIDAWYSPTGNRDKLAIAHTPSAAPAALSGLSLHRAMTAPSNLRPWRAVVVSQS